MRRIPELFRVAPGGFRLSAGAIGSRVLTTLDVSFTTGQAWNAGPVAVTALVTCARALAGYYTDLSGCLTSFAANTARIGNRGLFTEAARTNLCLQSQTFDSATWTKTRATASADSTTAPDGTATADSLIEDNTATSTHLATQAITITTTTYAWSIYAKANGRTWIAIDANDGTARLTYFQLSGAGAVGTNAAGNTSTITPLDNGWYRCTVERTAAATGGGITVFLATADATNSYSGDAASGVYLWGAQVELSTASYGASSYVPTTTVGVARAADVVTFADLTWFDGASTSIYAEWTARNVASAAVWLFDATNDITLNEQSGMAPRLSDGGATVAITTGNTTAAGTVAKAAGRMATNDYAFCLNGGTVGADTSATQPGTLAASRLGLDLAGANPLNGYIRRVAAFKTVQVADASLQALTTG